MINSIRKFLLINLLVSIIVTTSLTLLGNHFLDQKDIKHQLDSLLSQAGLVFEALLSNDLGKRDLNQLQEELNNVPLIAQEYYHSLDNPFDYRYEDKFEFQIWDLKTKKLLLHSANAPLEPLSDGTPGFASVNATEGAWRVFTSHDKKDGVIINIAERANIRQELGRRILRDDLYIMLLVYPLLGLLIWIIVGKGLNPLTKVANEVSSRAPGHLSPVDITHVPVEIMPLVDELNKLFLRLQRALDREKRFAADAAHELRTPLAGLKTQTQLALKIDNEKERSVALNRLIGSVDRCTHIVEQLLTLSRLVPEEPNTLQDIGAVNLHGLAVEIITMLVPKAIDNDIELELVCPNVNISVIGNNIALGILLRNLIDNAMRYSPPGSHIKIVIAESAEHIILSVIDNGPGIPPELRSRVFERFFRVLGNKAPGSGLGLAIVQQIAALHQAEVKLGTPDSGKGLEVNVYFKKNLHINSDNS